MSFSIESWMKHYQKQVGKEFGNRIWFIGLQGSYGRGEATEKSDIDVVFILDHMSIEDLQRDVYKRQENELQIWIYHHTEYETLLDRL